MHARSFPVLICTQYELIGVLQVVDGNWGIHCIVPKWMFNMSDMTPYMPVVMPGTSKPANMTLQTTL